MRPAPHAKRLALALALAPCACQSATANVLAVWLDAAIDVDGARAIQIYDAGERRVIELRPTIADSDTGQIHVGVAPGGGGFAVSSIKGGTVWVDLIRGTRGTISAGPWGELGEGIYYSRSGRALMRGLPEDAEPGYVLLPIATFATTPLWLRGPVPEHPGATGFIRSASDAPIVYWAEQGLESAPGDPVRIDGTVVAYAYPADDAREPIDDLVELGRTRMHTRAIDESTFSERIGGTSDWCSAGFCVTPDGDAAIGISPTPCELLRFQWARKDGDGDSRPAREITLPLGCGIASEPHLLAALDATHVLLDDDERLYLADLDHDLWTAMPKLGVGSDTYMLPAAGGRVVNLVSITGSVMRADVRGLHIVNAERAACDRKGPPLTSPDGQWVLLTCQGAVDSIVEIDVASDLGTILRISHLGLERFDGLAMQGLGIDDDGSALLYSYDPDDNEEVPRGLFVLEASGQLSRIDELEPTPEAFRRGTGFAYFDAAPR